MSSLPHTAYPSFDPVLRHAIDRALMARGGEVKGGEIHFRCPMPGHPHRATWNPRTEMWSCDVCAMGGGAVDLAERLDLTLSDRLLLPPQSVAGKGA